MDLLFLTLIFVFIILPIAVGVLLYFIPKKLGYPKVGKVLVITYVIALLSVLIYTLYEDDFFTSADAKKLIEEQNIVLNDKFNLVDNHTSWSISDSYHTFTLQISAEDWKNAKNAIREAKGFKAENESIESLIWQDIERYKGNKVIQNYETYNDYVREYFQPSGENGVAPTFRRISVSKTENKLLFEDIVE